MSFEEEFLKYFPSLKNNYFVYKMMNDRTWQMIINEETLRLKCLDKQKVKKVINKDWLLFKDRLDLEKQFLKWAKENNVKICPMSFIGWYSGKYKQSLKKELGLE